MSIKRIAITAAAVAALAGGAAAAVAHTGGKQEEQAVLDAAAAKLGVTPEALRDALGDAIDAQIDEAVKDGRLTQEQAEEIKRRRQESGRVLGPGPRHHGFGRGHGRRGPAAGRGIMGDVANALGITERQLFNRLRNGKSVAEIASDEGRSLADVRSDVRAAVARRLDRAVEDGHITDARRDSMLGHLDEHLERLGQRWEHPHGPRAMGP